MGPVAAMVVWWSGVAAGWQAALGGRPGLRWVSQRATTAEQATSTEMAPATDSPNAFTTAREVGAGLKGSVRMRFAPSPTGSLHVGGARTALYNWLVARKQHGKFIVRIEDTDLARSTRESEDSMLADLEWLGLQWDEGPRVAGPAELYRQSERSELYKNAALSLVASGHAYPCFCSEEELEEKRKQAQASGKQVAYDGTWRDADPAEVSRRLENGEPHTIRFRAPAVVVGIDDKIRGRIEWDVQATIGDFILLRSSGVPVYNFCVAVDDALMGVSTVVRAEEHLTNTVRQLLVLEALGFAAPEYAHASLILGTDRSKLSKRHGATSCGQFRDKGYLPDAMINYLALLGWNDGTDQEVYSREELIQAFDLNRVVPSPAMFDEQKLRWLNGQHLRAMLVDDLAPQTRRFFDMSDDFDLPEEGLQDFLLAATRMAQPKAELVSDIVTLTRDALGYPLNATLQDPKVAALLDDGFADFAIAVCRAYDAGQAPAFFYGKPDDDPDASLKRWLDDLGAATDRKKKRLFMPARLALTGRVAGPDIAAQLTTLAHAHNAGVGVPGLAPLDCRIAQLKQWAKGSASPDALALADADDDAIRFKNHPVVKVPLSPSSFLSHPASP